MKKLPIGIQTFKNLISEGYSNEVREWYDGYNWLGEKVYNPFNILFFLRNKAFRSYWFETDTS